MNKTIATFVACLLMPILCAANGAPAVPPPSPSSTSSSTSHVANNPSAESAAAATARAAAGAAAVSGARSGDVSGTVSGSNDASTSTTVEDSSKSKTAVFVAPPPAWVPPLPVTCLNARVSNRAGSIGFGLLSGATGDSDPRDCTLLQIRAAMIERCAYLSAKTIEDALVREHLPSYTAPAAPQDLRDLSLAECDASKLPRVVLKAEPPADSLVGLGGTGTPAVSAASCTVNVEQPLAPVAKGRKATPPAVADACPAPKSPTAASQRAAAPAKRT